MASAIGGIFVVVAELAKGHAAIFHTVGFIAIVILVGAIGFYLGINPPRR